MYHDKINTLAKQNLVKAFQIIEELQIQKIWEELHSTCHLVGSVKTGLLLTHLDIDFHVYSENFSIAQSFKAIAKISDYPSIKEVTYKNLLQEEDMCLEWHLSYEECPERIWTIDIIHLKNESPFAGMIERITQKIDTVLTKDLRNKILNLKWESNLHDEKVASIELYEAVIDHGIETFDNLKKWQNEKDKNRISLWEPY